MPHLPRRDDVAVLVIGAQGVLGALVARSLETAGWQVTRGGRRPGSAEHFVHVDLAEPETLERALADVDAVVNTVPDHALVAERLILERGGTLLNISAMPAVAGVRLKETSSQASGTVVMNGGIAPGVTNLVVADLLERYPDADEVEMAFTVSTKNGAGAAGGQFAHRGLTGVARHEARMIPLAKPFGTRRCLGFAEADRGWIGDIAAGRAVNTFLCLAERPAQSALMAVNRAGLISKLPRAAFSGASGGGERNPTVEPVAHWIAVRVRGRRLAAKSVECNGDYAGAAQSAVVFLDALLARNLVAGTTCGVFNPEEVLTLTELAQPLREAGIAVLGQTPALGHQRQSEHLAAKP